MFSMPVDQTSVLAHCDGFDVVDHAVGELNVTVWTGKDGAVQRFVTETRGTHYLRNSASGLAVNSAYHRRFMSDVSAERVQIVGPQHHVTVPGYGNVMFETGLIRFENGTMTRHGQHDTMGGDVSRLCAAFA